MLSALAVPLARGVLRTRRKPSVGANGIASAWCLASSASPARMPSTGDCALACPCMHAMVARAPASDPPDAIETMGSRANASKTAKTERERRLTMIPSYTCSLRVDKVRAGAYNPPMRLPTNVHELHRGRFVFSLALAVGAASGIPSLLVGGVDDRSLQFAAVIFAGVVWWGAAVFFAWAAVRDSRYALFRSAVLMTLGFALGDLVTYVLSFMSAWAQTEGDYARAYFDAPLSTTLPGIFIPILLRVPIRFVIAAGLLALARTIFERSRTAETLASPAA